MRNFVYILILLAYIQCYSQKNKKPLYDVNKVSIQLNELRNSTLVSSSDKFLLFRGENNFSIWSAKNQRKLYDFFMDASEIKAILTPNSKDIIFFLKKNNNESIFTGKLEIKSGLYKEKEIKNKDFDPLNFKAKFKTNNEIDRLHIYANNSLWSFHIENLTVEKSLSLQKNLEDNYIDFLFVNENHICFKIESDIKQRYSVSQLKPSEWKLDSIMLLDKTSKKLSKIKLQENVIGAYAHTENKVIVDYKTKISTLNVYNLEEQEYPKKENERIYKTFKEEGKTLLLLGDLDLDQAKKSKEDSLQKEYEKHGKGLSFDMYLHNTEQWPYNLLRVDKIDIQNQYINGKVNLPFHFYWDPCDNYFMTDYSVVYNKMNGIFSYYPEINTSQRWNLDYTRESLSIREGLTVSDKGDFTFFGNEGLTVLNVANENGVKQIEANLILKNKFFLRNQNVLSVYLKKENKKNLILIEIKNDEGVLLWKSELIDSKIKEEVNINTYINQDETKAFISISPLFYDENNKVYSYVLDLEKQDISKNKYNHGFLISKDFSFSTNFFNDTFFIYNNNSKDEQTIENSDFLTVLDNNDILYKENNEEDFILSGTVSEKGIEKKTEYSFPTTKSFNLKLAPFHYQNAKKLIFGANKNQLFTWKLDEKKPLKKITLNYDNAVYLTSSNKQLFIYYDNGFIDILDLETFNIVSTFTIHTKNENTYKAFFNKDLQFFIPKEIIREYHFVKGFETFPLLSYELFLNRPDIILSNLGYTDGETLEIYKKAYLKRLKNSGYSEQTDYLSIVKPKISLKNREAISSITTTKTLQLDLETSGDIDSTFIYINGVPIIKDKISKKDFIKSVALGNGLNKITIIGSNKKGIKSEPISFETTFDTFEKPKIYYIGVGVSKYLDESMNLKFADKDVRSISEKLSAKFKGRIQIDTLTNTNATKENILKLKAILNKTTINDVVIISFSGHGLVNDKNDFFFATHNIDFNNPVLNGLSFEDIQDLIKDIPARKRLLLIDACHSGELDNDEIITTENTSENVTSYIPEGAKGAIAVTRKSGFKTSFEVMKSLFYDTDRGNGAFVISAAGGKEFAYESKDWGNGVFTYSFLKAIEELTLDKYNNKQPITISMIKDYIYRNVIELTNNQQKPTSRSDNIEWDWILID